MSQRDRLIAALRAADVAGNTEDARKLAAAIRALDKAPTVGAAGAVGLGAADALTAGFADELAGAGAAGIQYTGAAQRRLREAVKRGDVLGAVAETARSAIMPIETLARGVAGQDIPAAAQARSAATQDLRALQQAAQEQQPLAYGAGQIGASLAIPMGAGARTGGALAARGAKALIDRGVSPLVARRLGQMGSGAITGAAIGAPTAAASAFGAGEGSIIERLQNVPEAAATGAAFGGVLGGAAQPAARVADRLLTNVPSLRFGTPAPAAPVAPQPIRANVDLRGKITMPNVAAWSQQGQNVAAARAAEAVGAQHSQAAAEAYGVRLTRGQATGNFDHIAEEEAMAKGARGERAGQLMRDRYDEQQQAVINAGRSLAGPAGRVPPLERGQQVVSGLAARRTEMRQAVDGAYARFGAMPGEVAQETLPELGAVIQRALQNARIRRNPSTERLLPKTFDAIDNLDDTVRNLTERLPGGGVALDELEGLRRALNQFVDAAASSGNRADLSSALAVRNAFDGWVEDAVGRATIRGDGQAALAALREARALNRQYQQAFAPGTDEPGALLVRQITSRRTTPGEAASMLFGSRALGNPDQTAAAIRRMRDTGVLDDAQFQGLKEGFLNNLMDPVARQVGNRQEPGYVALKNRLDDLLEGKNQAFLRTLFSEEEIARIQGFRDVVDRLIKPSGTTNPSGTAYAAQRAVAEAMRRMPGGPIMGELTGALQGMIGASGARSALESVPPRVPQPPTPVPQIAPMFQRPVAQRVISPARAGYVGGLMGSQYAREPRQ